MLLDVTLGNDSLSIDIEDPFHVDVDSIVAKIKGFTEPRNVPLDDIDVAGLVPRMIRGIAGCEGGCPANALDLVDRGFRNFELKYIEGGILAASLDIETGKSLQFKMFPDF